MFSLQRVHQLLLLAVLSILTANEASAQDECTKGFPFACFVHLWENETNAGKEFVHAFNTEAFFDAHCKDVEKCNTDCPTTLTKVDKSDGRNKGFVFKCNPKKLFCSEKKKVECIPIRKVYRLSEKGSSSQPQPAPQEPIETTSTDSDEARTTTQEPPPAPPAKRDVNRQFTPHKLDNTTKTDAPPAPAPSDGDSFVPDLVEIQTIVLPICRREDTEKDCLALTSGRFCTIKEASVLYLSREYLPWNDIKNICTIVESPLGGESPKWFAEYVENKKENLRPMKAVWEFTGLPFDIVTNKSSPFLAHRHDQGTKDCKKYAENTESCLPLPICDDGKHFITYIIRMKSLLNPNGGYSVKQGESECERACEAWEEPTGDNQCRVLDIEHLPLDRQNSPPYAKFATLYDNLKRRKSGSTERNEMPNLHELTTERVQPARRDVAANLTTPTRYYGRPIDLETVSEEDYAAIESNYWLSTNRNPFYKKYGNKIKLAKASMCTFNSKETFCRSPPTTPNSNVNKTRQNFKETSSWPWWTILLIVLACLAVVCLVILLIVCSIRAFGNVHFLRNRRLEAGGNKKPPGKKPKILLDTAFALTRRPQAPQGRTPQDTQPIISNLTSTLKSSLKNQAEVWQNKKDRKELAKLAGLFGFSKNWQGRDGFQTFNMPNTYIYTDSSRHPDSATTGIGTFYGIDHPLNLGLKIANTTHAFFGELLAINVALHRVLLWGGYKNGGNIILRTDCMNVIIALYNLKDGKKEKLIDKEKKDIGLNQAGKNDVENLYSLLQRFPSVTIQWVPSHVGDMGNEHADALASYGRCGKIDNWTSHVDEDKKTELTNHPWALRPYRQIPFVRNDPKFEKPTHIDYPKQGSIQKILQEQQRELQLDVVKEINKDLE